MWDGSGGMLEDGALGGDVGKDGKDVARRPAQFNGLNMNMQI